MAFEIITGSFTSGIHESLTERISKLIIDGKKSILIVPEQTTLSAEREMSELLPDSAPLYFEVSNFTRFANTAFRTLGGLANEHSDRVRRALVMWQALTELSPFLKILKVKGSVSAGLVNKAIAALNEAESFGISSEELAWAATALKGKEARLSDKLSDLSLVLSTYKKLLYEKYKDTGDELSALCERLDAHPDYLKDVSIFIESFTSFTESQYKLIAKLMQRTDITLALNISRHSEDSFEFTETRLARTKLVRIASKLGVKLKLTRLDGFYTGTEPKIAELADMLWHSSAAELEPPENECVRIFEAKHPYEECAFVADDILRRVREGASYSDIAVIARHADSYIGVLDDAFIKRGIPHFISKPRDITSFEAVKHIYSAISSVISGFAREDVMSYAKGAFSDISREACDEFELYVETWQLTGRRFTDGELWNMRPEGYTVRRAEGSDEKLIRINETKEKLMLPLIELSAKFEHAKTVRDFALALIDFTVRTELEEKIARRSDELYLIGEEESAEENEALWRTVCDSLDVLVTAAGDSECDAESFKHRLELVFGEAKIGRIPSFKEQVTVGSADSIRLGRTKHLYLIGVCAGEFPPVPKDSAFFADKEKLILSSAGIEMESSSEYEYARELFYFSRAFASAKESVTLLYTASDFSFKQTKPAEPIDKLSKLTGGSLKVRKISDLPFSEKIYSKVSALSYSTKSENLKKSLINLGFGDEIKHRESSVKNDSLFISPNTAKLMYDSDLYLSQTRIEKFIDCPLAYFCQYKLSLSENEKAELDARNIGSFIHAILEQFFITVKKLGKDVSNISAEEKGEIAFDAAKKYITALGYDTEKSKRDRFSFDRLETAALPVIDELCDELSGCRFEPKFFELEIESKNAVSPGAAGFPLAGGGYSKVIGSIDRVDTYKSGDDVYVRVIDYKTGSKDFKPSDLDEGRNMQMFLYLKSIVESRDGEFLKELGVGPEGRLIPAGVIYIKTSLNDARVNHSTDDEFAAFRKNQKREGMLLNDEESIGAMNRDYIPVSFKKDGSPTAHTENKLYTEEGWRQICEKLKNAVVKVSEEMKSGIISARPMKNKKISPCTYCSFKPICRNAGAEQKKNEK